MTLRPGSSLWLLRHELRLSWRNTGLKRLWIVLIGGGFIWACIHLIAWGAVKGADLVALPTWVTPMFGAMTWFAFTLMLSQGILLSVNALFVRGDFDLLLSSPLSARSVFLVRGLGIAFSCTILYLLLLSPFAHVGLFTGHLRLLAIYPTLISLGLLATSLGMLLTLTLVRLLGARRARTVAQLIGAFAGAALFLLSQMQSLLGSETRAHLVVAVEKMIVPGGGLGSDSDLWIPFRAGLGEPLALAITMLVGIGGFALVVNLTYRRFLAGTQETVTGSAKKTAPRAGAWKFRRGLWRNVLAKEWKLILRDPNLIAQTLLQMLYLLPLLFLAFKSNEKLAMAVSGAVGLAGMLANSLAWITVAAEDAPELIGVAPVALSRIRWMKMIAALLPVWILISPLAIYLLTQSLFLSAVFVSCIAGSTISLGVTQIWYPRKGHRSDMKKRGHSGPLIAILESIAAFGWAGAAYCLMVAPLFTPLALILALLAPAATWILGRSRRESGVLV